MKKCTEVAKIGQRRRQVVFCACWYVGMALLLNAFLQWGVGMPAFLSAHPLLFVSGSLAMALALVALHGVFGNPFLGTAAAAACLVLLTCADRVKYALRMEHVYPGDLEMFFHLNDLSGMYDASETTLSWAAAFGVLAAGIVATVLLVRARRKRPRENAGWRYKRYRVVLRSLLVVCGVLALLLVTWPVRSPNEGDITGIDYDYIAWNQNMNYERNGFAIAFISNLKQTWLEEPEDYSEERISEIAERYRRIADSRNKGRRNIADADVDVVYVMNESFCDPDRFREYYPFSGEPQELVPNLHKIYEKSSAGWVYSPRYGGGTANVEFEALTGFSTYYTGFAYPYQSILPDMEEFPSMARVLSSDARAAVGLHPYGGSMYRRNAVYPIFGYDEFVGSEGFHFTAHDRNASYISDESAYRELEMWLSGSGSFRADNLFATLITMQNHPQYGRQYADHAFLSMADESYQNKWKITDYMELIHSSDAALGSFVDWVDAREKKTVVVFWGDHLPGVYDGLFDIDPALGYETPFFIYKNFDDAAGMAQGEPLPTISPNYISTVFMDAMSAQKPPWHYLLDDVREDAPILTTEYLKEESLADTPALEDYHMIEYDMLKGEQYASQYEFFDIETED